jgi:hypothetical protein
MCPMSQSKATVAPASPRAAISAAARLDRPEIWLALAAFVVFCIAVLSFAPRLVEPDDHAYQASIIAITSGHFLTLSTTQARELAASPGPFGGPRSAPIQWVRLPDGRWISEKDPGYPYLAAPFQALGIIRLTPLFYGALGCLGLFIGGRRWLGRYGGTAAVGLFCSSGAALLFAWRDYMPTFTEAALIAAGTGALLWAVLATEASERRRSLAGLAGFVALEVAASVRYTDVVVLACAVAAVAGARWLGRDRVPAEALAWWLGSVVLFCAGLAVFNDLVYGGPLRSGYRPGEITFSLGAVGPNLRYLPVHLVDAMPELLPGLVAVAWILLRWARHRHAIGEPGRDVRRDAGAGVALAACWLGLWALYLTYTWTAGPFLSTLQVVRFYVPAIGAMSLLGAWLVVRVPPRGLPVAVVLVTVLAFGLGLWSYQSMREFQLGFGIGPQPPARIARLSGTSSAGGGVRLTRMSLRR